MTRRRALYASVALGFALALAPIAFQMFSRAPMGGDMIDDFRPHMAAAEIDRFDGYLDEIGAAADAAGREPALAGTRPVAQWRRQWPAIDEDMSSMLATMRENIPRFEGIDALPPFPLFPWFFVVPGLLLAAAALVAARATAGARRRLGVAAIALLGVGLIAAPAVFQMFTRAPGGARMIDDFRPLMTSEKVATVQGYFVTIGAAEASLRTAGAAGSDPAIAQLVEDWPEIGKRMAPMIGAMADNVDNFTAVDALPPFDLFPWFFVAPGLIALGLALAASRPTGGQFEGLASSATTRAALVLVAVVALVTSACGGGDGGGDGGAGDEATGDELVGLFRITAGSCSGASVSGSTFRMVQSGGTVDGGPFVPNGDSPCTDKDVTPLEPGTDGGLRTGAYQPHPDPAFDPSGNATTGAITKPTRWFAVAFGVATNESDPQTGAKVPVPRITADGTALSGDLAAFGAAWNGQHFNQGAPKPDGSRPGATTLPSGTYDPATKAFALEWASQIVGGPFNGFTGIWHLEGTFEPA